MFTIRKKFTAEYAHQLVSSFSKPCQTLHGHSATIEVFLSSKEITEDEMIIDFSKIKSFIKDDIIETFDHALILNKDMNNDYLDMIQKHNFRVKLVDYNPTAEAMAKDICLQIREKLNEDWDKAQSVRLAVRFHETATGYAEYSEDEN